MTTLNAAAGAAVTVADDGADVTVKPRGVTPDAVALSWTDPASTSACDTVYDPVHVVDAPGASVVTGHDTDTAPAGATGTSDTDNEPTVIFPVFVTTNEYETTWPAAVTDVGDADFTIAKDRVA